METVLLGLKEQTLTEYRDLRSREGETRRLANTGWAEQLRGARSQLDDKAFDIVELEAEADAVRADIGSVASRQKRYWDAMDIVVKDGPTHGACSCCDCASKRKMEAILAAHREGSSYMRALQTLLGHGDTRTSSLERERAAIREEAQRQSPFGRTGSYRGFGTGALKPRRHLNANNRR